MRLIDADEVIENIVAERDKIPHELVSEKPFKHGNSMRGGIRKALRCIEQAPTVYSVPVARCLECKNHGSSVFHHDRLFCREHERYVDPDGYCYPGEWKEGAD